MQGTCLHCLLADQETGNVHQQQSHPVNLKHPLQQTWSYNNFPSPKCSITSQNIIHKHLESNGQICKPKPSYTFGSVPEGLHGPQSACPLSDDPQFICKVIMGQLYLNLYTCGLMYVFHVDRDLYFLFTLSHYTLFIVHYGDHTNLE